MKSEFILFSICAAIVATICIVASDEISVNILQLPTLSAGPTVAQAAAATTAPSEHKTRPVKKPMVPKPTEVTAEIAAVPSAPDTAPARVTEAPPVSAKPVAKPFPTVNQIAAGVQKASVTDRFGEPSMLTTTSDDGHTLETYVYSRDGGRAVTVVQFRDGRVANVSSR